MRISSNMIFDQSVRTMNQQTSDLLHTQQQISTGRRILTPSDDPVAAAQALQVTQAQDISTQYTTNQSNAQSSLGLESSQLTSVSDILNQVRTLAVQGANSTLSNSDRASIATQMTADFNELVGIANATDGNGQYLFSGYQGSTKPFSATVGGNPVSSYAGDSGQRLLQVAASRQIPVSDSGNAVFNDIKSGNGLFTTNYAAGNTGSGVIDSGSINDPSKWNSASNSGQYQIKFAGISAATGSVAVPSGGVTGIAAGNDQFTLSVDGGTAKIITIPTPTTAGTFDPATDLAALQTNIDTALGAGVATVSVDASNHLVVTAAGSTTGTGVAVGAISGDTGMASLFGTPTTTAPSTKYDIVDTSTGNSVFTGAASKAGSYTHTYTAGQPIPLFQYTGGASVDLGASVTITGAPANGDVFNVAASKNQDVFTTLSNLITALQTGNTNTPAGAAKFATDMGSALTNIDQASQNILTVRASVGSRLNEITALGSSNSTTNLQLSQTLSTLQDVDMAKAISDLTQQQTGLQAAQQSFAKVSQLSLFSYL
ncbi:flagellar hook-associated protein 3 [mine drainage metagenome]|uniref:Flagellar hook-associated protein 3 n=1 Tax=mine drainage metagenome TaxID=410659 RepID=A0A1J5RV51_9ZZZZ